MAVFQRAQKKGERVYLFGAPAKATVEAEEEACGLATENEDQSNIFVTRRVQVRKFMKLFSKIYKSVGFIKVGLLLIW